MEAMQPKPRANQQSPVWPMLIAEMQARHKLGVERYGTPLQPHNGRDALRDCLEELLDGAAYIRQAIHEREHPLIDTVYIDMDGVLVDFILGALQAHGAGTEKLRPGEPRLEDCLGVTEKEFWVKCKGEAFWSELAPMPDASVISTLIYKYFPLSHTYLLSSPSWDAGCYAGKFNWVCREMPILANRLILTGHKTCLARPGALLVDDSDKNINAWRAAGGAGILVPRIWNSRFQLRGMASEVLSIELDNLKERNDDAGSSVAG